MNKKHFVVFVNELGVHSTSNKDWARANKELFPKFGFTGKKGDTPTTDVIEAYLIANGFERKENRKMVICYNFDI